MRDIFLTGALTKERSSQDEWRILVHNLEPTYERTLTGQLTRLQLRETRVVIVADPEAGACPKNRALTRTGPPQWPKGEAMQAASS